jgi:hypothetical protein
MLMASTKLETLLIHVPDVFRGERRMHVQDCLKKVVKAAHIVELKF